MVAKLKLVAMLVLTLALAMVAESKSFSHFNSATIGFAHGSHGRVGDMLNKNEEMMMPSESARRSLAGNNHIGYAAMMQGSTPCNQRGASYYNCARMGPAEPYRRGCSRITNCRRTG